MQIIQTTFGGWPNALILRNEQVELVITLDVGPRILSYRTLEGENVLKVYESQSGGQGEAAWQIRGGHRLWIAPEGDQCYAPDNTPVRHEPVENGVRLHSDPVTPWGIRKELTVTLAPDSSEVTLHHRLVNESASPVDIASWGLTVLAPGGLELIPVPPLGEHPRDLLPARVIVPWPYTDMTDPRYRFGRDFITLRQTADAPSTKIGLAHKERWVGYLLGDTFFAKAFDYEEGATYTDLGCNFETYTDAEMIEIESLSPLHHLQPGDAVAHTETWNLFGSLPQPSSLKEDDLARWVAESIAPRFTFLR